MWKFWSLTFLFLSLRLKKLVSLPTPLIKKARVDSKCCRQNGDKWEGVRGRESLVLWEGRSWCKTQLVMGSPGGCLQHSQRRHYLSHPKTSESLGLTQSICSTLHPYMHFCVLLSINRGLNSKLLEEHCSFYFQNILLFLLWHYIFGIGSPSYLPSGDLWVNIYKEMITKSQNGFTENWPCGTNPIFSF